MMISETRSARGIVYLLLLLYISGLGSVAFATEPESADDALRESWSRYRDVVECFDCHYGGVAANPLRKASTEGVFSRQIEARIWLHEDKHAVARQRIEPVGAEPREPSNALSRRICDMLGWDVETAQGYQTFREQCLTCHAGYRHETGSEAWELPEAVRPGIGCNDCHQLADNDAWVRQHPSAGQWRMLDPQTKAAAGMRPLQSYVDQGRLCADCHVGNLAEGKFVTHAMFTAGHPPLPNFELETFCEAMPRHWQTAAELHASLSNHPDRDEYFALNHPQFGAHPPGKKVAFADADRVRAVLHGGIQSRRQWVHMLLDAAQSDHWGDYAIYDCFACHHDLQRQSPRQEYAWPGVPGRPRQPIWTLVLAHVAVTQSQFEHRWQEAERVLAEAMDRQPFGDREACRHAAQQSLAILDQLSLELESRPLEDNQLQQVVSSLSEVPQFFLVDYLAARQVLWSLHRLQGSAAATETDVIDRHGRQFVTQHGILLELPAGRQRPIYPDHVQLDSELRSEYRGLEITTLK